MFDLLMQRLRTRIKSSTFLIGSFLVLVMGLVGAQAQWYRQHHRYDQPQTGAYYGLVSASLASPEDAYSLYFRGTTVTRWYWRLPRNFAYKSLSLEWHRYGEQSSDGSASLDLPSFSYHAKGASGVLSRDLLATWLLGSTNLDSTNIDSARVEALFGYLQAAGRGTLPPPNHHGHSFGYESEDLLRGRIQHFRVGYGVGSYVYLWIAVWIIGNVVAARMNVIDRLRDGA